MSIDNAVKPRSLSPDEEKFLAWVRDEYGVMSPEALQATAIMTGGIKCFHNIYTTREDAIRKEASKRGIRLGHRS